MIKVKPNHLSLNKRVVNSGNSIKISPEIIDPSPILKMDPDSSFIVFNPSIIPFYFYIFNV